MLLKNIFKTPSNISFPATGVDFASQTIRFIKLSKGKNGITPDFYFEKEMPKDSVIDGSIVDKKSFIDFLKKIKKEHNVKYVRLTIPESKVFLFTLSVDISKDKNIEKTISKSIEEYTLLKSKEAVFDYSILSQKGNALTVQVVAAPEKYISEFIEIFENASMYIVSIEFDAQAIARAVVSKDDLASKIIVDIGGNHTGISIAVRGIVVYSETIPFGGNVLNSFVAKRMGISEEEVEKKKKNLGLLQLKDKDFFDVLSLHLKPLIREIDETFKYWQTTKDRHVGFNSIDKVYLCGGHSNMKALDEYLTAVLSLKVERVNPWINCLSYNSYIPKITLEESMSYVPAIGIALSNHITSTNLLPKRYKKLFNSIRRYRYYNSIVWGIILSLITFIALLVPTYLIVDREEKINLNEFNNFIVENEIPSSIIFENLESRIDSLEDKIADVNNYVDILEIRNAIVTEGVYIHRYYYNNKTIEIQGELQDMDSYNNFVEKIKSIKDVLSVNGIVEDSDNDNIKIFSLNIYLK